MAFPSRAPHPDEVLKTALNSDPAPVVVLTGGLDRAGVEPWYVDHAVKAITERALEGIPRDFNFDRLRAEESGSDLVLGRAETLPVMASHRVVVVSDVDRWRASEHERMLAYLERPAPSTVLILSSMKLDRRTGFTKALEAFEKPASAKKKGGRGHLWRFRKLEPAELARALTGHARKAKKTLTAPAAEEMVRRAGEDLRLLLTELDKLVSFVGQDRDQIDDEDVAAATAGAGMSDVFAYADALGRGELAAALQRLRTVLDAGSSAYELIGGLAWHFRTMLRAKGGAQAFGRRQQEIAAAARVFPTRALLAAHKEIYRADVTLKSAQGPTGLKDEAVMDRLTRRICSLRSA